MTEIATRRPSFGNGKRSPPTVCVVGAGPVGLAAALVVANAGYDVTLVGPNAAADERTSALFVGALKLLEQIGLWPQLADIGAPLRTLRIIDGTDRLIRAPEVTFAASEIGLDAFGYNLPNAALTAALEAAVAERSVRRVPALVDAVGLEADAVRLTTSTGELIAAQLAVAADGRRSKLRDSLGINVSAWGYDQSALVCNFRHTLPHHDTSTEFHTETGPFTVVPLAPGRSSLVWVDRPASTNRRLSLDDSILAAEIEARSASILGTITIEGGRQAFPLSGITARRFAADRVMLVGEAAHVFPPIGAQGLNLGYRDVAALGDVLSGPRPDPGDAGRIGAYDRARRVDVVLRTRAIDALNRMLLSDLLPVQAMRGAGLFALDRVPALKQFAMRQGIAG